MTESQDLWTQIKVCKILSLLNKFKACDCSLCPFCTPSVEMLHNSVLWMCIFVVTEKNIISDLFLITDTKQTAVQLQNFKPPTLCARLNLYIWPWPFQWTRIRISDPHWRSLNSYVKTCNITNKCTARFFDLWCVSVVCLINIVPSSVHLIKVINLAQENTPTFE